MAGTDEHHLHQHLNRTSSTQSTSASHSLAGAFPSSDTPKASKGRHTRGIKQISPTAEVAGSSTSSLNNISGRPRRSARISSAATPPASNSAQLSGETGRSSGAWKRRQSSSSNPTPLVPSDLTVESAADRKGKRKASPSPPSSPLTECPSETEPAKRPPKRIRSSPSVPGKRYGLRRKAAGSSPGPSRASSSAKGKGKAELTKGGTKLRAKMPRKASTQKNKGGGGTGTPGDRSKKGDATPKQLVEDDMEGIDSQWMDERPGPSRSHHTMTDNDDAMDGSDHEDEDEDEDQSDDEAGPMPAGPSGRNAYERLARLAGQSGMPLDDATAMALFGSDFRSFGGMGGGGLSSRFKRLKTNLRSKKAATRLSALRECSELLLVSNEDTLGGSFSTNAFATEFIAILKGQPNIDENGEDVAPSHLEEMDEDAQLAAALAMSTGGAMPAGFGGDNEEEMECQLVACRCLAHLLEALPGSGHTLVHLGAVPALCSKLNEIAYIELAEQTLSTMEKISAEYPAAIVREGGLAALLNFLPFFSTNVQRTALTAAANCCRNIAGEHYEKIKDVFPILRDTLTQAEQRLVEQATLAVVRTIDSYRHNSGHLEGLLDLPTVVAINSLLMPSGGSPLISQTTYTHLLRALTTSARSSATVTIAFLEAGMTNTVYQILTGVLPPQHDEDEQGGSAGGQGLAGGVADMAVLQNLAHRPKDQVEEALALICELLPPTPKDGVFDGRAYSEKGLNRIKKGRKTDRPEQAPRRSSRTAEKEASAASTGPATPTAGSSTLPSERTPGVTANMSQATKDALMKQKKDAETQAEQRLTMLQGHPQLVGRFIRSIVPVLVDVYAASVTVRVRTKVLNGLVKAVAFGQSEQLRITLQAVPMASFLGTIISSKDNPYFVSCALQIVEMLVVKLKDIYQPSFMREGVVFEIQALADQEVSTAKAAREKEEAAVLAAVKTEPEDRDESVAGPSTSTAPAPLTPPAPASVVPASLIEDLKPIFAAGGMTSALSSMLADVGALGVVPSTPGKPQVDPNDANIFRARVIMAKKLFEGDVDQQNAATQVLDKLAQQVALLRGPQATDGELRDALRAIAGQFTSIEQSLSSFELLKSGLIDGLLDFVDVEGTVGGADRRHLMYEVFSDAGGSTASPLVMLVRRLHESLGRLETFEVETAFNGVADSSRPSSSNLGRTMRIRLQAEEGQDVPRQVNALSVTIQAIAPMQALHDFLRPRVADGNYIAHHGSSVFGAGGLGGLGAANGASAGLSGSGGLMIPRGSGFGGGSGRLLSALRAAGEMGTMAPTGPSGTQLLATSAPESSRRMAPSSLTNAAQASSPVDATAPRPEGDGQGSSTTKAEQKPHRRRSARLSAQASKHDMEEDADDDPPPAPTSPAPAPLSSSAPESSMFPAMPMDMDFDDDFSDDYGEEVFEEDMEEELARPQEKVVNMSVAPDGSRVEAKTPEGTRVATPSQGASSSQTGPPPAGSATPRTGSYAGAVKAPPVNWHLEFSLNGKRVSLEDTIYGAVHRHSASTGDAGSSSVFGGPYGAPVVLKFRKIDGPPVTKETLDAPTPGSVVSTLPSALDPDAPTSKILRLLRVVYNLTMEGKEAISRSDAQIDATLFVNNKLTAKLGRQLEEIMIIASNCMPDWAIELPKHFSFLFPFETRYSFLQATSFGYGRLIARYQAAQQARTSNNNQRRDDLSHLARIVRQKVRISRSQLLESAAKVLELYGTSNGILEVEYFDEIGTGLGPTLEFYSLASKEFARRALRLWRDEDESKPGPYVFHPKGLYPAPIGSDEPLASVSGSRLSWFKTIGLFAGRALLDSRIIDINLNKVFLRRILGQPVKKNIATLKQVDSVLARSMERLQAYAQARKEIETLKLPMSTRRGKLLALTVNGAHLQDLSLDFTLPGYDIELKPGGRMIDVDDSNLEEYLELVLDKTLGSGITQQVKAFQEGFSMIFDIADMRIFAPEELGLLIGNADEDWSKETIEQSIKADHGYTLESRAVQNLVDVMAAYDKEERRQFLQFITGAPKLPIGGFRGLNPPFTVVRKPHEAPFRADDYLPSVMTCAQYLKMPDYSTREALHQQLKRAMLDGGGSFHLS